MEHYIELTDPKHPSDRNATPYFLNENIPVISINKTKEKKERYTALLFNLHKLKWNHCCYATPPLGISSPIE